MRCPFCGDLSSQVKDSRSSEDGAAIRRRRQCDGCAARFTTFERIQLRDLVVIKKDGRREAFDRAKLARAGVVGPDDDLWILGDFAACETDVGRAAARNAFAALPGRKHLVRGNHDPDWLLEALPWASVHDLVEVQDGDRRFVLCHYPMVTWNGSREGAIQLFGHVHTWWRGAGGQVNVGVDLWDFAPVTPDQAGIAASLLPPLALRAQADGLT